MDVRFIKIWVLVSLVLSFMTCVSSGFSGYSYAKFRGPVSGPEKEITVVTHDPHHPHHHPKHSHDFVAKPDYHFAYGVEDPKTMVKQSRHETRYGDAVKGEYSVLDPDGKFRTVKYTADKHNGFQAEIITDHHNSHHDQSVEHYPMPPVHHKPKTHSHEIHHHEYEVPEVYHHEPPDVYHHEPPHVYHHQDHTPPDIYHHTPQVHGHEVHHHEEHTPHGHQQEDDGTTYNEDESSEGGVAYEDTDDSDGNEGSDEDGDDGDTYY